MSLNYLADSRHCEIKGCELKIIDRSTRRNTMPILKDITTGESYRIHICHQCDSDIYPKGKPVENTDWIARKCMELWA